MMYVNMRRVQSIKDGPHEVESDHLYNRRRVTAAKAGPVRSTATQSLFHIFC